MILSAFSPTPPMNVSALSAGFAAHRQKETYSIVTISSTQIKKQEWDPPSPSQDCHCCTRANCSNNLPTYPRHLSEDQPLMLLYLFCRWNYHRLICVFRWSAGGNAGFNLHWLFSAFWGSIRITMFFVVFFCGSRRCAEDSAGSAFYQLRTYY